MRDWSEYVPYSKALSEIYRDALTELAVPYPAIKLPGSPNFNAVTGGLRKNEFTILCGATGVGKTTLLANWAKKLVEVGEKTFVMSVETGATDFVKRTMSAFIGRDLNTGDAVPVERLRAFDSEYGHHFKSDSLFLSLHDNRVNHEEVMEEIIYHHEHKKCSVVMIDNLNFLMDVVKSADQIVEMDRVVHDLIMLCKSTPIHIVMVMHPKKTDGGRVESEFDIKGSSTAVQEAHNVCLFNRVKEEDMHKWGLNKLHRELTFKKMRRRGECVGKRLIYSSVGSRYVEDKLL